MSKRKVEVFLDDQENSKRQRTSQTETRIPLQDINPNTTTRNANVAANNQNNDSDLEQEKDAKGETDETQNQETMKKLNSLNQIQAIKEMLKVTKTYGEPIVGGKACALPNLPLPGLFVRDFGEILLPLCSEHAEELIKTCKQATYGSNLVDSNAFELEADKIEIRNDSWNHGLSKLVEKIADDIGCVGKVKANLSKMVLFKQGGHFKKHRDTEKERGMFGTLIIQLPSIYTGGELIVYGSRGAQFKYDFGQANGKSGYSVHYAAFISDLEHKILEVTSGNKLVLIYNLCCENGIGHISLNLIPSSRTILEVNFALIKVSIILKFNFVKIKKNNAVTRAIKFIDLTRSKSYFSKKQKL